MNWGVDGMVDGGTSNALKRSIDTTQIGASGGSRFFLLDSGEPVPSLGNGPRTLRAFAKRAVSKRQAGRAILEVDGAAAIVRTLRFGTTTLVIIGTPLLAETRSAQFGARFHVAILRPGQPTIVEELIPRTRLDTGQLAPPGDAPIHADPVTEKPSERYTPDGIQLQFESRVLFESNREKVLQVTVTEGDGRGVYLLGLEYADARLTGDALLVATQAPVYNHCKTWLLPLTAVQMRIAKKPFSALLDIERANLEVPDTRDGGWAIDPRTPHCRIKAEVRWQARLGFEVQRQPVTCDASAPLRVSIDPDGRITSSTERLIQRPRR